MEPANSIIKKLGGEAAVSALLTEAAVRLAQPELNLSYTAPYRWQYARDKGGTDGLIPQRYHPLLLEYARSQGIPLAAEEFLPPSPNLSPQDSEPASEPERQAS